MNRIQSDREDLPWRIVSVASGKGGVGKTLTTVNMALALSLAGKKTLILDGDLGMSNVDVVLGLQPRYNINDVIHHQIPIEDVVLKGPLGLRIVPSGSGITKLAQLSYAQKVDVLRELHAVRQGAEILIIDTGAGISQDVLHLNSLAEENIVVTTPEPHAVTDAYAFMKVMNANYQKDKFHLIVNMARYEDEGFKCYQKLAEVAERFLRVSVNLLGIVPLDPIVHRAVMQRRVINEETFQTVSGQAWKNCAYRISEAITSTKDSDKQRFWHNLILKHSQSPAPEYA